MLTSYLHDILCEKDGKASMVLHLSGPANKGYFAMNLTELHDEVTLELLQYQTNYSEVFRQACK